MWLSANQLPGKSRFLRGLGLAAALGLTGCQMNIGGQTLPSPYWQTDDVQYFPPGVEFKLSREAAAMKAFKQDQARAGQAVPPQAVGPVPGMGPGPGPGPGVGPGPAPGPAAGVGPGPAPDDAAP